MSIMCTFFAPGLFSKSQFAGFRIFFRDNYHAKTMMEFILNVCSFPKSRIYRGYVDLGVAHGPKSSASPNIRRYVEEGLKSDTT